MTSSDVRMVEEGLGDNYKVIDLARPLAEIEQELADEYERRFVRYEKEHGARIALLLKQREA